MLEIDRRNFERLSQCLERLAQAEATLGGVRGELRDICKLSSTDGGDTTDGTARSIAGCFAETTNGGVPVSPTQNGKAEQKPGTGRVEHKVEKAGSRKFEHMESVSSFFSPKISHQDKKKDIFSTLMRVSDSETGRRAPAPTRRSPTAEFRAQVDMVILKSLHGNEISRAFRSEGSKRSASFLLGSASIHAVEAKDNALKVESDIAFSPVCGIPVPVIHPEAGNLLLWLLIGNLFIAYDVFSAPYLLAFEVEVTGSLYAMASLMNIYFILDIIVNFTTAFRNSKGNVVNNHRLIAARYACRWLWFDICAAIPWEWLPMQSNAQATTRIAKFRFLRAVRFLRCIRLLRVMKLDNAPKLMEIITDSAWLQRCSGLVTYFGLGTCLIHWLACLWYYIGQSTTHGRSWVREYLIDKDDLYFDASCATDHSAYLYSVYFILTTMTTVGYGDMSPQNSNEVCFCLVLLLVSCFVFGGLTGHITSAIESFNQKSRELSARRQRLARYMQWRAVPKKLRRRIMGHCNFVWELQAGVDKEETILEELPPVLRLELSYHIHGRILNSAPFLAWMRGYEACVKELSAFVEHHVFETNDYLFRLGETNDRIFMILEGAVYLSRNESVLGTEEHDWSNPFDMRAPTLLSSNHLGTWSTYHAEKAALKQRQGLKRSTTVVVESNGSTSQASAADLFENTVLWKATLKLRREELRLHYAARVVQRAWRERQAGRSTHPRKKSTREKIGISQLSSVELRAPAYLGEACLWVPLDQWEEKPVRYQYAAKVLERVEVSCIPRRGIRTVLQRFDPWLQERLDIFRCSVEQSVSEAISAAKRTRSFCSERSDSRKSTLGASCAPSSFMDFSTTCPQIGRPSAGRNDMAEAVPHIGAMEDEDIVWNSASFWCSGDRTVEPMAPPGRSVNVCVQ